MTYEILTWGLRMGVLTSVLIGLVLLIRRPFVKYFGAQATFLLWSLPALRLIMPDIRLPVKHDIAPFQEVSFEQMEMFMRGRFDVDPVPASNALPIIPPIEATSSMDIAGWIVFIWIGVGALWMSYHMTRHYKFAHLLKDVSSMPAVSMNTMITQAQSKMGLARAPQVLVAPKNIGPFVTGVIKPLIIVPNNFVTNYSKEAQLFALCHEMSHIKRRDFIWAFALLIFRAVHWYNPLVHYAARRFRLDQEAACDAHSLSKFSGDGDTYDYAMTLLMNEHTDKDPDNKRGAMPALSLALTKLPNGASHDI
ncbi:MAG: M56 family metallopeptidase [Litorimonas sp.]